MSLFSGFSSPPLLWFVPSASANRSSPSRVVVHKDLVGRLEQDSLWSSASLWLSSTKNVDYSWGFHYSRSRNESWFKVIIYWITRDGKKKCSGKEGRKEMERDLPARKFISVVTRTKINLCFVEFCGEFLIFVGFTMMSYWKAGGRTRIRNNYNLKKWKQFDNNTNHFNIKRLPFRVDQIE